MTPSELGVRLGNKASEVITKHREILEAHPGYPAWREALHQIALEKDPEALRPDSSQCRVYAIHLAENGHDAERIMATFMLIFQP